MSFTVYKAGDADAKRVDTDWGCLRWLANKAIGNAEGFTLGRVTIKAGTSNPPHSHGNCEEALYLLTGRLEHFIGDESVLLEPGDTLVVAAGVPHYARSVGDEDADMIVAYSSAERDFRKEA
ncbi:MAG TPA: cupin domain-containing protein [Phycisphaerae bacterium]|nr:cupin domain-containing protein [Phycisphaerae bacterium]